MNKPRKHANVIKAWADGAEVEVKSKENQDWITTEFPAWNESNEYRIKTYHDLEEFMYCQKDSLGLIFTKTSSFDNNLKLTFDVETGKLKSAEVLK